MFIPFVCFVIAVAPTSTQAPREFLDQAGGLGELQLSLGHLRAAAARTLGRASAEARAEALRSTPLVLRSPNPEV